MDCIRWARKEVGTAPFPMVKEYQQLKRGAYNEKEDSDCEIVIYTANEEHRQSSDKVEILKPPTEFGEEFAEQRCEQE